MINVCVVNTDDQIFDAVIYELFKSYILFPLRLHSIMIDSITYSMSEERYFENSYKYKLHRLDGPTYKWWDEFGNLCREDWYLDGILQED